MLQTLTLNGAVKFRLKPELDSVLSLYGTLVSAYSAQLRMTIWDSHLTGVFRGEVLHRGNDALGDQLAVGGRSLLLDQLRFLATYRCKQAATKIQQRLSDAVTHFSVDHLSIRTIFTEQWRTTQNTHSTGYMLSSWKS